MRNLIAKKKKPLRVIAGLHLFTCLAVRTLFTAQKMMFTPWGALPAKVNVYRLDGALPKVISGVFLPTLKSHISAAPDRSHYCGTQ